MLGLKHVLVLSLILFSVAVRGQELYQGLASEKDVQMMKEAKIRNADTLALSVGFYNYTRTPYPNNYKGYDVSIDYSMNCYVVFANEDRTEYDMIEAPQEPEGEFGVYMSHTGPCGVCSHLQDLAVYLETPDLTTPVTKCAKILRSGKKKQCLRDIGFTEPCLHIWYWNSIYTRNGCLNICLRYQNKPRNEPEGTYNPCKPLPGSLPNQEDEDLDIANPNEITSSGKYRPHAEQVEVEEVEELPSEQIQLARKPKKRRTIAGRLKAKINSGVSAFAALTKSKTVGCRTSINKQPTCKDFQWQNNPQRLNPCLQCDECKAGPMFQKVSGRQRRNSGIMSGIGRPIQGEYDHHYFTG